MWLMALVVAALVLASCSDSQPPPPERAAASTPTATAPAAGRDHGAAGCAMQSGASFPAAFTDPDNLVVGPLVLIGGGAFTDERTVREVGGQKYPLLVRAGHTVTVRLAPDARPIAGLAYGPLPQGEIGVRATSRSVTFVACRPADAISDASGVPVTFWSGFILTRRPACIPLDVIVDGALRPRVTVELGARC